MDIRKRPAGAIAVLVAWALIGGALILLLGRGLIISLSIPLPFVFAVLVASAVTVFAVMYGGQALVDLREAWIAVAVIGFFLCLAGSTLKSVNLIAYGLPMFVAGFYTSRPLQTV